MEQRLLIVKNIPDSCTQDTIENYLEVICDNDVEDIAYFDDSVKHIALVTFKEKLGDTADIQIKANKRKLEKQKVELTDVTPPRGVIVSQLPKTITEDTLLFYFESKKKSGGEDGGVEKCTLYSNLAVAVVEFSNSTICSNVLAVDNHYPVKNQPAVKVEPFYKGYQDEAVVFLNTLHPMRTTSGGDNSTKYCEHTDVSISEESVKEDRQSQEKFVEELAQERWVESGTEMVSIESKPQHFHKTTGEGMISVLGCNPRLTNTAADKHTDTYTKTDKDTMVSINMLERREEKREAETSTRRRSIEPMDTDDKSYILDSEKSNPYEASQFPTWRPPVPPKPKIKSLKEEPRDCQEPTCKASVKFDPANTRLLQVSRVAEKDFMMCTVNYNTTSGMIQMEGPENKLQELKLKMYESNQLIYKDSHNLHQDIVHIVNTEKGKTLVETVLQKKEDSVWYLDGQQFICATFSETCTEDIIKEMKKLVQQKTVPYNDSHFKYVNGAQWKEFLQGLEREHTVKVSVERASKQVRIDGLGVDTEKCKQTISQELKVNALRSGKYSMTGSLARCLKEGFSQDMTGIKRLISDSGVGHFDDSGGKNSLHLKFDGDPETVKKVEVELKQLEKKVWHEKLHLVKDVAPEKHSNLLIRGLLRSDVKAFQAAFEVQNSVFLELNLPGAPRPTATPSLTTSDTSKSKRASKSLAHSKSEPVLEEEELKIFSNFGRTMRGPKRSSFHPPRRHSPVRPQNTTVKYGNITLTVKKGDISKEKVDVLVNVVPKTLDLSGTAVSQSYSRAGGPEFSMQFEASKAMYIAGGIIQTNSCGKLQAKMIYTFVLEKWKPPKSKNDLKTIIDTCLKTAAGNGYSSIAMTSFGCGKLFHFPEKFVASCLVKAVKANSTGNSLQQVSMVLYDHGTYQTFLDEINPGSSSTLRHSSTMPGDLVDPFDTYPLTDTTITVGSTNVTVKQGDITRAKAVVMVNVVSEDLKFGVTAVSQALIRAGGKQLYQEFETEKDSPAANNIIVTTGGNLGCSYIYHVVLKRWSASGSKEYQDTVRECFKLAASHGTKSVVCPALGCGMLFKYPPDIVASTLIEEAKRSSIQNVTFVIYDRSMVHTFLQELRGHDNDDDDDDDDDDEDDTNSDNSLDLSTLRQYRMAAKADQVVHEDNKTANITIYGISKDVCKAAKTTLKKQLVEDYLHDETIQHENLTHLPSKSISNMKQLADKSGIWIKFPDPDKKKTKDTPKLKLKGEKKAVLSVKSDIQGILLKAVVRPVHKPFKVTGSRGSKKLLEEMASMSEFFPPSYWTHFKPKNPLKAVLLNIIGSKSTAKFKLVTVDQATFSAIDTLVQKTWDGTLVGHGKDAVGLNHKGVKVKQVERLEHPEMFTSYCQKRSARFRLACNDGGPFLPIEKLPGSKHAVKTTSNASAELKREVYQEINEHYFFHGTKGDAIQAILEQGLDSRVGSSSAMFGSGIYGAESSTKADQYTDDKSNRTTGDKQMLLMRMTLGHPLVSNNPKKYCRPPCRNLQHLDDKCKEKNHNGFFHSVIADGTWNFREFVVYESDLCYPEYVITYTRV